MSGGNKLSVILLFDFTDQKSCQLEPECWYSHKDRWDNIEISDLDLQACTEHWVQVFIEDNKVVFI